MNESLNLYRLQQADGQLTTIQARLSAIQAILENDAELLAARQRQQQAQENLHGAERALRQAEIDAQAQRIKLEQAESSLYSGRIQNPKELRDLQNDAASLKRHLATLEDILLEAMLSVEAAREEQEKAGGQVHAVEGKLISQNASLKSEQEALLRDQRRLQTEREAITQAIQPATLIKYDNLRQQRRGVAVSLVSENACETCGSALTPAQAQSVRISGQIIHCPACGRILYSK
jgi:hypothetical protein